MWSGGLGLIEFKDSARQGKTGGIRKEKERREEEKEETKREKNRKGPCIDTSGTVL